MPLSHGVSKAACNHCPNTLAHYTTDPAKKSNSSWWLNPDLDKIALQTSKYTTTHSIDTAKVSSAKARFLGRPQPKLFTSSATVYSNVPVIGEGLQIYHFDRLFPSHERQFDDWILYL